MVWLKDQYVLVTGGGGFIGGALVRYLVEQEAKVIVLDFLSPNRKARLLKIDGLIEFLDIETVDYLALFRRYDFCHVYHLAGHADIPKSVQRPLLDLRHNAQITLELLEAIRTVSPAIKFIFASSAAVYGEGGALQLEESQTVEPISPYGVHKLMVEHYLKIYSRLHGLRTASLRLFPVYGPGQTRWVIYELVKKIIANPDKVLIHGDGEQLRDFVYVDDVVKAFAFTAEHSLLVGDAYNLASGKSHSISEITHLIAELLGVDARFVYEGTLKAGVSEKWIANITKIKELGFTAETSFQDGLKATVSWIVSRGH